jgi:hypothetical protein
LSHDLGLSGEVEHTSSAIPVSSQVAVIAIVIVAGRLVGSSGTSGIRISCPQADKQAHQESYGCCRATLDSKQRWSCEFADFVELASPYDLIVTDSRQFVTLSSLDLPGRGAPGSYGMQVIFAGRQSGLAGGSGGVHEGQLAAKRHQVLTVMRDFAMQF